MEIAGAFGSLKAYHFETEVSNGPVAFLEVRVHFFLGGLKLMNSNSVVLH